MHAHKLGLVLAAFIGGWHLVWRGAVPMTVGTNRVLIL
jgi:hypothetical protein